MYKDTQNFPLPACSIVIFGQYKSGTTALFAKIKDALPEHTTFLFEPLAYKPSPEDKDRCVLSKTILKYPGHPEPVQYEDFLDFKYRIFLTRDPRDWLVSAALFLCQEKVAIYQSKKALAWIIEYLKSKESAPDKRPLMELIEFIMQAEPVMQLDSFASRINSLNTFCMEFEKRIRDNYCHIKYEDFVDHRIHALESYTNLSLKKEVVISREHAHVPRTLSHGNWKAWLTTEDVAFFKPYLQEYIEYYQYEPSWQLSKNPSILPMHASDYVARVVSMKRKQMGITELF